MRQSFSGIISAVTKHVDDEQGDVAVVDVVVASPFAAVPRRRVRRRGHLHAHAAEKHPGTELSIELIGQVIMKLQSWAMRWAQGCVNSPPPTRLSQEACFTQPKVHLQETNLIQRIRHQLNGMLCRKQ